MAITIRKRDCVDWLEKTLSLTSTDAIFVSLDFEYSLRKVLNGPVTKAGKPKKEYRISQMGIATLDTRDLGCVFPLPTGVDLISTQLFNIGHWPEANKKLLFGECTPITADDVKAVLVNALCVPDDRTVMGHFRDIVLVGHSLDQEVNIMSQFGLNLTDIAPIIATLDTHRISNKELGKGFSLFTLLKELGGVKMEHKDLFHNAANDANFTLRALLMLVTRCRERGHLTTWQLSRLATLENIAHSEIRDRKAPVSRTSRDLFDALDELPLLQGFPE